MQLFFFAEPGELVNSKLSTIIMSVSWRSAEDEFAFSPSKADVTISSVDVTASSESSNANTSSNRVKTEGASFLSGGGLFKSPARKSSSSLAKEVKEFKKASTPPSKMTSQRRGTYFGTYPGAQAEEKEEETEPLVSPPNAETKTGPEHEPELKPEPEVTTTPTSSTPHTPSLSTPDLPPREIVEHFQEIFVQDDNDNNASSSAPPLSTKAGLFCFELYVHSVEMDAPDSRHRKKRGGSGLKRPPSRPTVAFRFLDFPTQNVDRLVRSTEEKNEKGRRYSGKSRSWSVDVDFGKSCLLEGTPAGIHSRCQTTPLYVVLLDSKTPGIGKLLGATVIDLAGYSKAASKACVTALPPEAHYGAEGYIRSEYTLLNLVGGRIGTVELSLRLRNLGSHMLSHWRSTQDQSSVQLPRNMSANSSEHHSMKRKKKQQSHDDDDKRRREKQQQQQQQQQQQYQQHVAAAAAAAERQEDDQHRLSESEVREREKERALEATIRAITLVQQGRPGHDLVGPPVSTDSMPPPLFYHNSCNPTTTTTTSTPTTISSSSFSSSSANEKVSPYSRGAPEEGTSNIPKKIVSSQRRGTYFGTFTPEEARRRQIQTDHEEEIQFRDAEKNRHRNEQKKVKEGWFLNSSSGGGSSKGGLSLSDRRKREIQLRSMWLDQTPMVEAWESALIGNENNSQAVARLSSDAMDLLDMS